MLGLFKKKLKVVTHDGSFHADETFACAALSLWAENRGYKLEIIRTRNPEIIQKADMAVDVGMAYDPEKGRFDHHQKEGVGVRGNGIPYASFGLIWKHYGEEICGSKAVAEMIERKLILPIDARDNSVNISKILREDVPEYSLTRELVFAFKPTWQDPISDYDKKFGEFLEVVKKILINEIRVCTANAVGENKVSQEMKKQNSPAILALEEDLPWEEVVSKEEQIKVVVYPRYGKKMWYAETARGNVGDFQSGRVIFPNAWWGLRGQDLERISGIEGSVFCHKTGWLAVSETKKGAMQMAEIALREGQK